VRDYCSGAYTPSYSQDRLAPEKVAYWYFRLNGLLQTAARPTRDLVGLGSERLRIENRIEALL
jgi:hypothetical protein